MDDLLLGVDLGTTGTKTALYTAGGDVLAEASAETPLHWHGPGAVDQDPEDFYAATTRTIAECLERSSVAGARVAAIGITGQMAGVLGIDDRWRPSIPCQRPSAKADGLSRARSMHRATECTAG